MLAGVDTATMSWLARLRATAAATAGLSSDLALPGNSDAAPVLKPLVRRHTPLQNVSMSITGADFRDGTFLEKWCDRCARIATQVAGRPCLLSPMMQCVFSHCTGFGMDQHGPPYPRLLPGKFREGIHPNKIFNFGHMRNGKFKSQLGEGIERVCVSNGGRALQFQYFAGCSIY